MKQYLSIGTIMTHLPISVFIEQSILISNFQRSESTLTNAAPAHLLSVICKTTGMEIKVAIANSLTANLLVDIKLVEMGTCMSYYYS
jgi:hypothetical protein